MAVSITKESAALYKVDFNEHCKVEIGSVALSTFRPKAVFKKWDECWVSLEPQKAYTQKLPAEVGASKIDKVTLESDDAKEAHHFYPLDESENHAQEEGLFELEAVVNEKPASGGFVYVWNLDYSDNLKFIKQDPLSAPLRGRVASRDEFGGYDSEGKQIEFWEPEAFNSWAIYRNDLPSMLSQADGAKYKAGSVGRLRRPKIIDAVGAWEWAELNVDTTSGTVTVTGSEAFAKKAVLPVRIDPTFGYTTAGSFSSSDFDYILGAYDRPASPGRGIVTSLHAYISGWSSGEKLKMALITGADEYLKAPPTVERSDGHSGAQWATFTFSDPKPALQYLYYIIALWTDSTITFYYDFGSIGDGRDDFTATYGEWPREFALDTTVDLFSVYATFETSTIEKVRNVDHAYAYHYPGAKNIKVDGSFGATQGDAWVKIGNAEQWSSVTISDTCTINSWGASQIDITIPLNLVNDLGNLWLYVKPNGGSANAYGFPVVIKKEWGQRYPDGGSTTVNWCRAMGGLTPDVDNLVLESVSVYCGTSHGAQVRVAVYQGGALDDPSGATLVEDLGLTSGSDTEAWQVLTSSTNPSLTKNEVTWIVVKGNDSSFGVAFSSYSGGGDFQTARGRFDSVAISEVETAVFPATWPTDSSGAFADFWYSFFLTYSSPDTVFLQGQVDAEGTVTGSLSATRKLAGQVDAEGTITGSLSATVPLSGQVDAQGTVAGHLSEAVPIAGQIDGQSALAGSIFKLILLAGQIDGQSNVTGSLVATASLQGQINAQSALAGGLFATVPIRGRIDGDSTLTGSLSAAVPLVGQVDAQSALTGALLKTAGLTGQIDAQSVVTGSLLNTVPLSGQVDAQSALTGSLGNAVLLSGQVDAQSAVTGVMFAIKGLDGSVNAQSAVTGALSAVLPIAGQIDAQSVVTGLLLKPKVLIGQIDAQSVVTGSLSAVVPLVGQVAATSALAGSLSAVVPLVGQIDAQSVVTGALLKLIALSGQVDAQSAVTGALSAVVPLQGQIDAQSAVTGALSAVVPLQGQIDAQSAVTGALSAVVPLQGQVDAQSALTGSLSAVVPLAGQVAATSALTGSLAYTVSLAGQIDATSALTGSLFGAKILQGQITATSALTGSLSAVVPLAGQIDATSALTGSLAYTVPLAGQISATSALTGSLIYTVPLAGQITATSALTGSLSAVVPLVGQVDATSALAGSLSAVVPLAGQVDATSALTGSLLKLILLSGQVDAVSALAGSILRLAVLSGQIDAQSTITGSMVATVSLSGQVTAQSALSGLLFGTVPISGRIDAQSIVAGLLDVTVPADLSVDAFDVVRLDGFFDVRRLDGLMEVEKLDAYFEVKRGKND